MNRIKVGVLGATGMVGQNYLRILMDHPWFEIGYLAASPASAGQRYSDAVKGRWHMNVNLPEKIGSMIVEDANIVEKAAGRCEILFSALEMDKEKVRDLELAYAKAGFPVVSNASAHRWTEDVPMLIPEINDDHAEIILEQRKRHNMKGFIVVKPNCSLQSYLLPVHALLKAGYEVNRIIVSTMQAVSGAGYPGVASMDIVDNIIPFISGEEEKTEREPLKILGEIEDGKIVDRQGIRISAHCNRVPVVDGHTACVSLEFGDTKPELTEIKRIWKEFRGAPQKMGLPSAPSRPMIYLEEDNRPQPRKDRDSDKAMAVSIGRLRRCNVFDIRFVGLSHNTIRGAAGGGVLNAELLKARGYI